MRRPKTRSLLSRCSLILLAALGLCALAPAAAAGELLVASSGNNKLLRYDSNSGAFLGALVVGGGMNAPAALCHASMNSVLVASYATNRVRRYDAQTGAFMGDFVSASSGGLAGPSAICFAPDGNLLVASSQGGALLRYDGVSGAFLGTLVDASVGLGLIGGFTYGPEGDLYVASITRNAVLRFDAQSGAPLGIFAQGPAGGLTKPRGLVFDVQGRLLVASEGPHPVLRFKNDGSFDKIFIAAGQGQLASPRQLGLDEQGRLLVASYTNNAVLRFDASSGAFLGRAVEPGSGSLLGPSAFLITPSPKLALAGPTPGKAGSLSVLSASLATPGTPIFFVVGGLLGALPIPLCDGTTLGIVDPFLLGVRFADGKGVAQLGVVIPPAVTGVLVYLQAVEFGGCRISGVTKFTLQ